MATVGAIVTRSSPRTPWSRPRTRPSNWLDDASIRSARPSTSLPAPVTRYPEGSLSNNRAPSRSSSWATRLSTVAWFTPRRPAAARTEPPRAVARKWRMSSQPIMPRPAARLARRNALGRRSVQPDRSRATVARRSAPGAQHGRPCLAACGALASARTAPRRARPESRLARDATAQPTLPLLAPPSLRTVRVGHGHGPRASA